ncbi:MAG: hypothetical protein PHC66_03340 [Candidatus Nanoarchaeia archaeon]|nr:hypothetical protein [Candidatus Nanoarchaeia archaeon]MDD5239845.1 hypothetical protein [Candidatus Nanoarchaeia archaeon]
MFEQYNPLNIIKLIKAKIQLSALKKYMAQQNIMFLGKRYFHDTKLIDILAVEYLFINQLNPKIRHDNRESFDMFLKFQAHAILGADLINEGADRVVVGHSWKNLGELLKKIGKDEPELGNLAKEHLRLANELLKKLETKTGKRIAKEFDDAVAAGLGYLRQELEFADKVCAGDAKFAKSYIRQQFEKDTTLSHLTNARVSVIYTFLIDSFYTLFFETDPMPRCPQADLLRWAETLSKAMQESIDDIDDIEDDIPNHKPTPLILRILKYGSAYNGIKNSMLWNMNYLNSLERLKILPVIRAVEQIIAKKIKRRYYRLFSRHRKIDALIQKYFSILL